MGRDDNGTADQNDSDTEEDGDDAVGRRDSDTEAATDAATDSGEDDGAVRSSDACVRGVSTMDVFAWYR